jgi:hypothetical protein
MYRQKSSENGAPPDFDRITPAIAQEKVCGEAAQWEAN